MGLAAGIFLILLGGIMWHIAAGSTGARNIGDVWKDILATMQGKALK